MAGLPKWGRKERKTTKNKNKFESKDNEKVRGQRRSHRATTKSKDNDPVSKVQQRQKTKQNKVTRQTQGQTKMTKTKSNDKKRGLTTNRNPKTKQRFNDQGDIKAEHEHTDKGLKHKWVEHKSRKQNF